MAFASTQIPAAERSAFDDDKPCILTHNALRNYSVLPEWSTAADWATGGSGGGTNVSVANFPGYFAHDGHGNLRTYPVGSAINDFYLLFHLDELETIDCAAIVNHNFADFSGTTNAWFRISDNADFTAPTDLVASFLPAGGTSQRLVEPDLGSNGGAGEWKRFTGVKYAYLHVFNSSGFSSSVYPQVGECFLGRRRQLSRKISKPGDDRSMQSSISSFESDSGNSTNFVHYKKRRVITPTWIVSSDDTVDDKQAWEDIYNDLDGGTEPFIYIPDPTTSPRIAPLMFFPNPRDVRENLAQTIARVGFEMREKTPFERTER